MKTIDAAVTTSAEMKSGIASLTREMPEATNAVSSLSRDSLPSVKMVERRTATGVMRRIIHGSSKK